MTDKAHLERQFNRSIEDTADAVSKMHARMMKDGQDFADIAGAKLAAAGNPPERTQRLIAKALAAAREHAADTAAKSGATGSGRVGMEVVAFNDALTVALGALDELLEERTSKVAGRYGLDPETLMPVQREYSHSVTPQ